jgi:hypothetical protein
MMPSPRNTWIPIDLSMQGASTINMEAAPGVAGVIRQVTAGTNVIPTAGTLALAKGTVNILKDTNQDLAALTAGTAKDLELASAVETLRIKATDVLKAVWTITTAGSYVAGACTIWIEPDLT